MPQQIVIADSSQLSQWVDCAQNWNYGSAQHLIAINKQDPSETLRPGDALAAGSLGHKYLEIYYSTLFNSKDPGFAARTALNFDPDAADKADGMQFPLSQPLRDQVRNRFRDYLMTYAADRDFTVAHKKVPAVFAKDGLLVDAFIDDPLIEKGFTYKLFESSEYLFLLEGRVDFVGYAKDGTLLWMDHKFQFREHRLYPESIQFKNYSLALGMNLAVINYVRLHKTVCDKTFVREPISFGSQKLRYWKQELTEMYVGIAKQQASGEFPRNWGSCGGRWGHSCQFAPLCEEGNAEIRAAVQRRDFMKKERVWRPW